MDLTANMSIWQRTISILVRTVSPVVQSAASHSTDCTLAATHLYLGLFNADMLSIEMIC
jgi:hypothetical protein